MKERLTSSGGKEGDVRWSKVGQIDLPSAADPGNVRQLRLGVVLLVPAAAHQAVSGAEKSDERQARHRIPFLCDRSRGPRKVARIDAPHACAPEQLIKADVARHQWPHTKPPGRSKARSPEQTAVGKFVEFKARQKTDFGRGVADKCVLMFAWKRREFKLRVQNLHGGMERFTTAFAELTIANDRHIEACRGHKQ